MATQDDMQLLSDIFAELNEYVSGFVDNPQVQTAIDILNNLAERLRIAGNKEAIRRAVIQIRTDDPVDAETFYDIHSIDLDSINNIYQAMHTIQTMFPNMSDALKNSMIVVYTELIHFIDLIEPYTYTTDDYTVSPATPILGVLTLNNAKLLEKSIQKVIDRFGEFDYLYIIHKIINDRTISENMMKTFIEVSGYKIINDRRVLAYITKMKPAYGTHKYRKFKIAKSYIDTMSALLLRKKYPPEVAKKVAEVAGINYQPAIGRLTKKAQHARAVSTLNVSIPQNITKYVIGPYMNGYEKSKTYANILDKSRYRNTRKATSARTRPPVAGGGGGTRRSSSNKSRKSNK
jgi:hypothetical protein